MQAILNPPTNPKAKYFKLKGNTPDKQKKPPADVDKWLSGTEEVKGSWWPYWMEWLQLRAGDKIPAAASVGSKKHPPMESAPGLYVLD
jgi:polyhydroxyalkanoate synthase